MSSHFVHSEVVCADFESVKRVEEKLVRDNLSQTSPLKQFEKSSQSIRTRQAKVQTDSQIEEEITLYEDDSVELINFMKRIGPSVCEELERNGRSYAFNDYDVSKEEIGESIKVLYACQFEKYANKMAVTQIAWNSTGSVLAMCYGETEHSDWCTGHKSAIVTWNIDRSSFNASKPDYVIDLDACQSSISFHPTQPSLLASANFQGHICVWDLSKELDPIVANTETSGSEGRGHSEPITSLHWILDSDGKTYNVYR